MAATVALLTALVVATLTDIRFRKVYNSTTYPGIVFALVLSLIATLLAADSRESHDARWALVPVSDALVGFLMCGAIMLLCYVCFPGGVGGGDVKLLAMVGAFLGLYEGLEALLWTFLLAGCQAAILWIWRDGAWSVMRRGARSLWSILRWGSSPRGATGPAGEQITMFLSPSALAAVLLLRFGLLDR